MIKSLIPEDPWAAVLALSGSYKCRPQPHPRPTEPFLLIKIKYFLFQQEPWVTHIHIKF